MDACCSLGESSMAPLPGRPEVGEVTRVGDSWLGPDSGSDKMPVLLKAFPSRCFGLVDRKSLFGQSGDVA